MTLDLDRLRKQTLGSGHDEAVTVNTRALIDKVLARYSGEWTTLRELLQNAADAASKKVKVVLSSAPSMRVPLPTEPTVSGQLQHAILHHTLRSLTVENDGAAFGASDWARLKKIAEGNPDESKIGAFGVGFYSVFADCEEPFVSSGAETMAFYWKGDALFTKRMSLPPGQRSNTTFHLPYRNQETAIPDLLSLSKFLVSSLIFVGLESIELWLDQYKLLDLQCRVSPPMDLPIPAAINTKSAEGLMKVVRTERSVNHIAAKWLNAVFWTRSVDVKPVTTSLRTFFSRLTPSTAATARADQAAKDSAALQERLAADLCGENDAVLFVHIDKATLHTNVGAVLRAELERATKKPPPKSTSIHLLSSSLQERQASERESSDLHQERMLFDAFKVSNGRGRIFIGFTTTQTTGLDIHISMPSVIPTVERESIDLVNRVVRTWNAELLRTAGIVARIAWTADVSRLDHIAAAEVLHQQYGFTDTTPLPEVGRLLEEAFWTCNQTKALEIWSSTGVLPASKVRIKQEELTFADNIAAVPPTLLETAIIRKLIAYGIVGPVSMADIKNELAGRALNEVQLQQFLQWLLLKISKQELDIATAKTVMNPVVANYGENLLVMETITTFLNPVRIPAEMPLPGIVLPFEFSKTLNRELLASLFDELHLVPWLRWLVENESRQLTQSPKFAAAVLSVISKQWETLSQSSKATVISLFESRTVIPTKLGMRLPGEAYLPNVKLFQDLPNITSLQGVKEKVLVSLGVRKTIEIGLVLERLMKGQSEWNHVDLIRYLATISADIPPTDTRRLRETPLWPAEDRAQTFLITDLFQPESRLREFQLPLLQWPGPFRAESAEARFLLGLGLKTHPSFEELVGKRGGLEYFIDNHITFYSQVKITVPFVPVHGSDDLALPAQVYVNERSAVLGFRLLRKDLATHAAKLGVGQDPPVQACVARILANPPQTENEARSVFAYMATRGGDLSQLAHAAIVPLRQSKARGTPATCFLGTGECKYAEIFDYVDFGIEANTFLLRVGSKHEPSIIELGRQLIHSPAATYTALGDSRYLELLRAIADSWKVLKKDKELLRSLRKSKCLLCYRESASTEESVKSWQLAHAQEVVIVDDTLIFDMFKERLLVAPMEENLETLYRQFGSTDISALLRKRQTIGAQLADQSAAVQLHALIGERTRLFLHDFEADAIKHDHEWIERIECVQSINLTMLLDHYDVHRKVSRRAAMFDEKPVLYITAEVDMLEVSQALVPCLLHRVRPQSVFMLEMILESSLPKLRSRGYNVQRILNQRARQAQIAKEVQRQLEQEEQKMPGEFPKMHHNENASKPVETTVAKAENVPSDNVIQKGNQAKRKGFFSGLSKQLGLDRKPLVHDGGRPAASAPLEQNLQQAIEASRAYQSNSMSSQPSYVDVEESKTYCDAHQAHNISCVGERGGTRVFVAKDVLATSSGDEFLKANAIVIDLFTPVLHDAATSYGVRQEAVHVFFDIQGATIAFNSGGALFFNLRYFRELHVHPVQQGNRREAVVYWSVVLAHELAHNLVQDHSSAHSYWTETLIMQYFGQIVRSVSV